MKRKNLKKFPILYYFKATAFLLLTVLTNGTNAQQHPLEKIHIGLIYPISTNGKHAPLDTNDLSIHLLAGVSAEEKGVAFAGLSNLVRYNAHGGLFAGFSNHVGGRADGALFAGFLNTYRHGNNAAFAGFANAAYGQSKGVQLAGFGNVAKKLAGDQFAGFVNVAANISGTQFAGFINTAKNVRGSQFAGFINVAAKVKGIQLAGFINVADSSDCPIGILNFIRHGEKSIGISMDESETTLLTFRSGGKTLYGILAAGYNFKNKDEVYAFELGFGAHLLQSKYFRINAELTALMLESFYDGEYFRASLKLLPAVKLGKHIEIFGGPSLLLTSTNTIEGIALHKHYLSKWKQQYSDFQQTLSIGYGGGVHFLF